MARYEDSKWIETEYSQSYRDNSQHYIPDRQHLLALAASFYRYFVKGDGKKRVLDLGCGDGIVSETLLTVDPQVYLIAIDGSEEMLKAARNRLASYQVEEYRQATFQDMIDDQIEIGQFDFIISSFAIHHLELAQKIQLFDKIRDLLNDGAPFLNIDVVVPQLGSHEDWYYEFWREWIEQHEKEFRLSQTFTHVPDVARTRPENFYDSLEAQLEGLRKAGFEEVACHYRYGLFGIYSGRRV